MSNDSPPSGEFTAERLEELAQQTAVKIAAIHSTDATDLLFFVAASGSFAAAAKELPGNATEQGVRARFTRVFNNLELPFSGNHVEQNAQAMWVLGRAFQIVELAEERRKKEALQNHGASSAPIEPADIAPVAEQVTEPPPQPAEPEPAPTEHEPEPVEVELASTPTEPIVEATPEPAPQPAPALHVVVDPELKRVAGLMRAMPLDTDLRILAGYTFGGTHKDIGRLLGLSKDQVTKRIHKIRSSFRVPQLSEHGMFGSKEFDFLVRAFELAYPDGLNGLSQEELVA